MDQGALEWSTPIHDILPELSKSSSLEDAILSQRCGIVWSDVMFLQSDNSVLLLKEEGVRIFNSLKIIAPAPTEYMCNNDTFNIVDLITERSSSKNWGDCIKEKLFQPLNNTEISTLRYLTTSC